MRSKKNRTKIFIFVIIIITLVSVVYYTALKKDFQNNLEIVSDHSGCMEYQELFADFFLEKFRYPINLKELFDQFSYDSLYMHDLKTILIDPFSKKNSYLEYIPVYSDLSKLPEGYLLISAGIDGSINNIILDSIFFENIKELKFYNTLTNNNIVTYRDYFITFSIINSYFGRKDLLLETADGIAIYLNNCRNRTYTPTALMQELFPYSRLTRLDCTVEGDVKEFSQDTLLVYDGLTAVICSMYKGRKYDITNFGKVRIAGQYKNKIDPLHRAIFLDNCIMLTDDSIP